jgi:2-keto-4-pentenoate hydratase/2-oxohepta-3-ene-1,7-dioic acid hydratase in catechol pathway
MYIYKNIEIYRFAAKPPRTLNKGDKIKIEIEHIGILENHVE